MHELKHELKHDVDSYIEISRNTIIMDSTFGKSVLAWGF